MATAEEGAITAAARRLEPAGEAQVFLQRLEKGKGKAFKVCSTTGSD